MMAELLTAEEIGPFLKRLTIRTQRILKMRYGIDTLGYTYTLAETAKTFGGGIDRIRRLEETGLRRIKAMISEADHDPNPT